MSYSNSSCMEENCIANPSSHKSMTAKQKKEETLQPDARMKKLFYD